MAKGKKIKFTAVVKKVNTEAGGTNLAFKKMEVPTGQLSTLTDWCKGKEDVIVTIELKQPLLTDTD